MAVKKTLTSAKPFSEGGKVTRWSLVMKYEQGTEGEADYYTSDRSITIDAAETDDGVTVNNFTPKAEKSWTRKELEDLCPIAKWDEIFASQYDSVITNPKKEPVVNHDFVIPS